MGSEYKVIASYVIFLSVLGLFVSLGAKQILTNPPAAPTAPEAPNNVLDALFWVGNNVGYFFSLMIVTSIEYPFLAVITTAYTVVFIYMMLRLIRGGG